MEHKKNSKATSVKSGWSEFITEKLVMLDAFERSKIQIANRPTQTGKGSVAEAEFRQWLRQFLPKKYSVTSGYIISQADTFTSRIQLRNKLLHYDVIIYDELNSPILWIESNSDSSEQGKKRAIPAEYVHGVIEIKSTFNEKNISDAFRKLDELAPLLAEEDDENEPYKRYIPRNFYMGIVFFELLKKDQKKLQLLNKLVPTNFRRGFRGGAILQAEGMDRSLTGRFVYAVGKEPMSKYGGKDITLTTGTGGWSEGKELFPDEYVCCLLNWSLSDFAQFAFDLVATMNGTYRPGFVSSFHGLSFVLPSEEK